MSAPARRPVPKGFLWGTAISAHQSEGNNINSDAWLCETVPATLYREPSRDACDSYNRFSEDVAIAAGLGFNCYRFGTGHPADPIRSKGAPPPWPTPAIPRVCCTTPSTTGP